MPKRIGSLLAGALLVLVTGLSARAQDGAYSSFSPYTVYGVGDIYRQGTAYSKGMGGVGIAGRDHRYINYVNPAAVSARDSLAFMVDISLRQSNTIYHQGGMRSANNILNIGSFAFSFPIWRSSAMVFGISPYSSIGYNFATDHQATSAAPLSPSSMGTTTSTGQGGLYQVFGGAGATFWKRLSIGAQALFHFGKIQKGTAIDFIESSSRDITSGFSMSLTGLAGKFGAQWEQRLGLNVLTVGATYKTPTVLRGEITDYQYATLSSVTDTIRNVVSAPAASLASEVGVGVSLRQTEHWTVEVDYLFSDWRGSGMDRATGFSNIIKGGTTFAGSVSHAVRGGFEYIPNRYDRHYMRRCAYRGGLYYENAYFQVDGKPLNTFGLTFGMTLPVFQLYNGLTLGVDLGTRGGQSPNMIRENFFTFHIGFNIHDIWFRKLQYQ